MAQIIAENVRLINRSVPTVGQTVNMGDGREVYELLDPAGTLATLTVNLPASPQDGDSALISTSQIITTLTLGGTIVGTLTSLSLGGFARFIYNTAAGKWFRAG